jgi:Zn-dependent M16 (insulinase) family peptidase
VEALPADEFVAHQWRSLDLPPVEGLTLASQVNYVGKAVNLYDVGYQYNGAFNVVANYLRTGFLWERIRVQGGAYGAFTGFDQQSGTFTYLSYRDPNLLDTLAIYNQLPDFLRRLEISADELRKSIIGVIGDLDGYQLPDAKGMTALRRILLGITDEERQARRDEVLAASAADFHALGEALAAANAAYRAGAAEVAMDADTLATPQPHIVVLGGAEAITTAAAAIPGGPLTLTKVL